MTIFSSIFTSVRGPKSVDLGSHKMPKGMVAKKFVNPSKKDLQNIQLEVISNLPQLDKEFFSQVLE